MTTARICDASTADLPAILAIFNDVIAATTAVYSLQPVTLDERRAWFEARRKAGFPVLVAEEGAGGFTVPSRKECFPTCWKPDLP